MIEVVIRFDKAKEVFVVYEPTTDTLMASTNLTEALISLNKFLLDTGMSQVDILHCPDISYHIDSATMNSIIEGNMQLLKRLNQAPSGFMLSNRKFGQSMQGPMNSKKDQTFDPTKSGKKKKGGGSGSFSGATGFKGAFKKFGKNKL